jgi:hypothetical protein
MDLSLAGDLVSAGSALAGLVLVFLGGILNAYGLYDTAQQRAVKAKYSQRAWFCFAGFTLSLAGTVFAFFAALSDSGELLAVAASALGAALLVLLVMAVIEIRSI